MRQKPTTNWRSAMSLAAFLVLAGLWVWLVIWVADLSRYGLWILGGGLGVIAVVFAIFEIKYQRRPRFRSSEDGD